MSKTKEELNELKHELTSFTKKLQELSDEEMKTIVGGDNESLNCKKIIDFDLIPAPFSKPDITKRIVGTISQKVFADKTTGSVFTDENLDGNGDEYMPDINNESVFKERSNS